MVRMNSAYQARDGLGQPSAGRGRSVGQPPGARVHRLILVASTPCGSTVGELRFHPCGIALLAGAREHGVRCAFPGGVGFSMGFTVNRLGPQFAKGVFGAELLGANLHQPPTDELVDAFEEAMAKYAVVVLRDQHIDDAEQIRFARAFGPLELPPHMGMRPAAMKVRVGYGLYDISNLDADGNFLPEDSLRLIFNKGNENFHTDSSFNTLPTKWSMLSARVVPPSGGDTEFCDARAAWDALPDDLRERAESATAEHWLWKTRVDAGKMQVSDEMRNAMPPARHPVVRTVKDSGRTSLYLGAHVTHIVDWPQSDSAAIHHRHQFAYWPIRHFATFTSGAKAICWSGTTAAPCTARRPMKCSSTSATCGARPSTNTGQRFRRPPRSEFPRQGGRRALNSSSHGVEH